MTENLNFNRLKNENSLYLKQHQDNPIHWWSYGPEALSYAQKENKPIFFSIGYSSCHWCHVMNQESFNDQVTADFLNENFVCIKIDREENPDIDNYYQKAAQLYGSQGGWPLSVFTLNDTRPFFVGTYYPKVAKDQNTLTFLNLIKELKRAYHEDSEQVLKNATQALEAITNPPSLDGELKFEGHFPHPNAILDALKDFRDLKNGGYGAQPKFPTYAYFEWAIEQMLEGMVEKEQGEFIISSLEKMLMGAMNDHARGGTHRYSVDEKWLVPHFEKMLYDQASFLKTMTKLSLVYPSPLVFDSIINTLDYLENEMLSDVSADGKRHFFSAQDADSEGVEGLYFTFTENEFEDMVNAADDQDETLSKNMENIKKWFQISPKGNFENGLNVISLNPEFKEEIYQQQNWDMIRKIRRGILTERKERMPPMTDNKGVASWNFQMLTALCDVIQYSQIDVIKKMASNLLNTSLEGVFKTFIDNSDQGMKMKHSTTVEFSHSFLEDFVAFSESQLRLYELSGNEVFKQNFKDSLAFITSEFLDGDKLLTRAKSATGHELYPNQEYNIFDTSFKSPVATYILLMRRAAILFLNRDYNDQILALKDRVTQTVLKINPLGAGESLRALSYPTEAYRVMKLPKAWTQKEDFLKFIPFFLNRFVFDYHSENNNETFEVCNLNACELKGNGFQEFINTLTPAQAE